MLNYRKPTLTDHYLQFDSHHPLIHKLGVIRTLHYRADTVISSLQKIPEEKQHIQKSLGSCEYPKWAFAKARKTKDSTNTTSANQKSTSDSRTQVTIPYIAGLSERLKKNLEKLRNFHLLQTN